MSSTLKPEQLAWFPMWEGFSSDELAQVLTAFEDVLFAPGEVVVKVGDERQSLWFLVHGSAEVLLTTPHWAEQVVANLGLGGVMGEVSFLRPAAHSATVRCVSATHWLRLDRTRFDESLAHNSPLALRLMIRLAEILAARLNATDQIWQEAMSNDEDSRIRERGWKMRDAFHHFSDSSVAFLGVQSRI